MGKSGTYNYEVQVQEPGTEKLLLMGAMRYREAIDKLLDEARRINSYLGYIWPQTAIARKKINNIPWVTNQFSIDYLKLTIDINMPNKYKYTLSGKNIIEDSKKGG